MPGIKQRVLVLGFFLPADKPAEQKTPPVFKLHARPDQDVVVDRLDNFFVAWDRKSLQVADPKNTISLLDFDAVHIVDWSINPELSYAVSNYLQNHSIANTNSSILHANPETKLGELVRLTNENIAYPKSFYTGKGHKIAQLYEWAHANYDLQFPVIIKGTEAAQGADNFLVSSLEELQGLRVNPKGRYMMQEFIPNSFDYRVLIMGGQVSAIIKRTRVDDSSHLNNVSLGARAELIALESQPEIVRLAMQSAKALDRLDHAGVDIIINSRTGKASILEVNRRPDLSGGQPEIIKRKLNSLYDYIATLSQ